MKNFLDSRVWLAGTELGDLHVTDSAASRWTVGKSEPQIASRFCLVG